MPFAAALLALLSPFASAFCPVCTVAVAGGVGILRGCGVDDSITGLWYGGLIISSLLWTIDWMGKKNLKFPFRKPLTAIVYLVLFIGALYWPWPLVGEDCNKLFGIDKLVFGTFAGMAVFVFAVFANNYLKSQNNGKVIFPYQRVFVPVVLLALASIFMWLLVGLLR